MSTIKAFISQPMRDKTDEQILAERNRAIEAIKKNMAIMLQYWIRFSRMRPIIPILCGFWDNPLLFYRRLM